MSHRKRVIIVGGVAGGANVAARLRRLDEDAEIVVFERGEHVSFANCGLPYHIGGEIRDRAKLIVHTPQSLRSRFNIDVRTRHEVLSIDREGRSVCFRTADGEEGRESYDTLVLATGAAPVKPQLPGISQKGVFLLRDIGDMDRIIAWLDSRAPKRAVVVGGGFIGLEMVEQLHHRGLQLTLVESGKQVLHPLDEELARIVEQELAAHGVELVLGDAVERFDAGSDAVLDVVTRSGRHLPADVVLFGIGVRPESILAKEAGLVLGKSGGVVVDKHLRTSDANIFAVGDCIEFPHPLSGLPAVTALAGPANRQGRIAADNIAGLTSEYRGSIGTAVLRVFGLTAAVTGLNEKSLRAQNRTFQTVRLHAGSHASYYPGASRISLKITFAPDDGRLLGAQAVGKDGVDKRIDILATAIGAQMTIEDLVDLELCYAPPFGSAKDPVNLAGMVGQNILGGLELSIALPEELEGAFLLDVRSPAEFARGAIPGAINIPLDELRDRAGEVPTDRPSIVYCETGHRAHNAARTLRQRGVDARNLSGGYSTWRNRAVAASTC